MASDSPPPNGSSANVMTRMLNFIEWAGNKLPDPAVLFVIAFAVTVFLSWPMSFVTFDDVNPKSKAAEIKKVLDKRPQVSATTLGMLAAPSWAPLNTFAVAGAGSVPEKEPSKIKIKNLCTAEESINFLTVMVDQFTGFKPLGIVLVAMLGVGVAEHTGFISALIKSMLGVTPNKLLTPMLLLVAIVSHTAGDTGYVVVIPLGGIIFAAAGRHPVAGIVCAFAGVSGGFSANFVPSALDPLLSGFTQSAAQILDPNRSVNPLCNWIFMGVSCALIIGVGWFLTDKVIEPKLKGTPIDGDPEDIPKIEPITEAETKGMLGGVATFIGMALILVVSVMAFPQLWSDKAGSLTAFKAPLMTAIVPLIFLMFLIPGTVHGYIAGTVKNHRDVIKGMSKSMSDMGYYMVMAFFAAQFIYVFGRSELGILLAVKGATFLKSLGLPFQITIVGIILLSSFVNLLVGSASAKWALIGPIFVPMLIPLGISPELTQASYRIGDSSTNIITPLMPYFPLIVVYAQRYVKSTGIGTMIALMLPYSICFLITWTGLLLVFWQFGWPLGIPTNMEYYP